MDVQIPQFEKEIKTVSELMRETGEILLKNYESPKGIETKSDGTLVTGADKEVSRLILSGLEKKFPNYGILDEEHGGKKLHKKRVFLIDPLDNTRGYVERAGDFGIIIGILDSMKPTLGITFNPQKDEFAYAAKGLGAYIYKGERTAKLKVSDSKDVNAILSSFRSSRELEEMLKKIKPNSVKYMGGSLKTIEIAKGNANLFLCPRTSAMSAWDIFAPSVILEESEGRMTDVYGRKIEFQNLKNNKNYNGVVATNGYIHDKILEKISSQIL